MRAIALSLNLEADYFTEFCKDADLVTLRLLHYPLNQLMLNQMKKVAGHILDFGGLTLLLKTIIVVYKYGISQQTNGFGQSLLKIVMSLT